MIMMAIKTLAQMLLMVMMVVMRTLPGGDCLLKLFSWLALWDQRGLDILLQLSPGGLLEVLKGPHLQWLTANAR